MILLIRLISRPNPVGQLPQSIGNVPDRRILGLGALNTNRDAPISGMRQYAVRALAIRVVNNWLEYIGTRGYAGPGKSYR